MHGVVALHGGLYPQSGFVLLVRFVMVRILHLNVMVLSAAILACKSIFLEQAVEVFCKLITTLVK